MRNHLESRLTPPIAFAALMLLFAGINVLAVIIDPASAARGAPDTALESLAVGNRLGELTLLINCGFVFVYGTVAYFACTKGRVTSPMRSPHR